jgi:hypothetical protein
MVLPWSQHHPHAAAMAMTTILSMASATILLRHSVRGTEVEAMDMAIVHTTTLETTFHQHLVWHVTVEAMATTTIHAILPATSLPQHSHGHHRLRQATSMNAPRTTLFPTLLLEIMTQSRLLVTGRRKSSRDSSRKRLGKARWITIERWRKITTSIICSETLFIRCTRDKHLVRVD